jgi:hypothetical protein
VGLEVDDAVDAHFATLAEVSRMKDSCTRGNEHLIFHGATHDVSIRADQAVIADAQRMSSGTSPNRGLHNDAFAANGYGPPSAMTCVPNITRQPGPTLTLPQMTAFGATQAVESIRGEMPSCVMRMGFSWVY